MSANIVELPEALFSAKQVVKCEVEGNCDLGLVWMVDSKEFCNRGNIYLKSG